MILKWGWTKGTAHWAGRGSLCTRQTFIPTEEPGRVCWWEWGRREAGLHTPLLKAGSPNRLSQEAAPRRSSGVMWGTHRRPLPGRSLLLISHQGDFPQRFLLFSPFSSKEGRCVFQKAHAWKVSSTSGGRALRHRAWLSIVILPEFTPSFQNELLPSKPILRW